MGNDWSDCEIDQTHLIPPILIVDLPIGKFTMLGYTQCVIEVTTLHLDGIKALRVY
jgi:hypothetical protein